MAFSSASKGARTDPKISGVHTFSIAAAVYVCHRPETTLLYEIVQEYWPEFRPELASHGRRLPTFITKEFDEYLKCGRLEHGFLRVRCESCHDEKLVAFSCKRREFCPSCGARRMADSAALLVDEILPFQPMLGITGDKLVEMKEDTYTSAPKQIQSGSWE